MLSPRSVQPGGFEARETREKRSAPAAQCSVAVDVRLIGRACSHCQPAFQKTYKWLRRSCLFPANSPAFPATCLLNHVVLQTFTGNQARARSCFPRRVTNVIANPAKARGPGKRKKINSADRRHSSGPAPPPRASRSRNSEGRASARGRFAPRVWAQPRVETCQVPAAFYLDPVMAQD
jgi:hypothetical protein